MVAVFVERGHHRRVAQRVDQPRHAARVLADFGVGLFGEDLPSFGAGDIETMQHVGANVFARQRAQVEAQTHTLRELHQFGRIELFVELGLARRE